MSICGYCAHENEGSPAACPACGKDPLVGGRFLLLGVLGRGGGGVSWKAKRLDLGDGGGELVCLKELRWDRMGSLKDEELFHREARILQTLDHPGIPRYIDELSWPDEVGPRYALWLAQELVDGENLELERTRRGHSLDGVLAIGESIAKTLAYLGERRPPVVHRDVKPSNIMRRRDGRLVLVDFGAARASGLVESSGTTVAGTFGFMAPEQMRGVASPATDVYGLGMTMLVLLSGEAPEALLDDHNLPDLSRVALEPALFELLQAMLSVSPGARPSASEVARRLARIRRGEVAPAPRVLPSRAPAAPAAQGSLSWIKWLFILPFGIPIIVAAAMFAMPSGSEESLPTRVVQPAPPAAPVPTVAPEPPVAPVEPIGQRFADLKEQMDALKLAHEHPEIALQQDIERCPSDHEACQRLWSKRTSQHDWLMANGFVQALEAACNNGLGDICGLRGTLSLDGDGVPRDAAVGRRYTVEGCEKGDVPTCFYSGRMLIDGDGGPIDAKLGVVHLQRACDAGNAAACMNIGVALARGQGIPADRAKALTIFETYCDQHDQTACANLDGTIGNGWGLPKDPKARFALLSRLCDKKLGNACWAANKAAASGQGTPRDAAAAADFRQRACNFGASSATRCTP